MRKTISTLLIFAVLAARSFALDWEIEMPFENTIFPSVVVGMRGFMENDELGDAMGMIGASITAPEDDYEVKVTIDETSFFKKSTIRTKLKKKGKTYSVMPILRYDVPTLLKHKQKGFDTAHVTVETPDGTFEDTKRFEVRSINDCVLGAMHEGEFINMRFLFAAYVNESNASLDRILGHALKKGYVDSFIGYQGTRADVIKQAGAIYKALQDLGFKYSSITTSSGTSKTIFTQHVRFVGESLETSQANCVDGTVLMASLFMKIGLNPVIISVPGHAFVGVYKSTAKKMEFLVPIETTVIDGSSFDYAMKVGQKKVTDHEEKFADSENMRYLIIDVREAREAGIDPIQEEKGEN